MNSDHEWDVLKWASAGYFCYRYQGIPHSLSTVQPEVLPFDSRVWRDRVKPAERTRLVSERIARGASVARKIKTEPLTLDEVELVIKGFR